MPDRTAVMRTGLIRYGAPGFSWQAKLILILKASRTTGVSFPFSWRTRAKKHYIQLHYIQPGRPQQNAYLERFNRSVWHEWLKQHLFESIACAQETAKQWLWRFNNERPH